MILVHSNLDKEIEDTLRRLVSWCGRQELILVYIEDNIFNLYLSTQVKSPENNIVNNSQSNNGVQSSAQVRRKHCTRDLAPNGDDIEPSQVPREDVEVRSEEEDEPFEIEVLCAR